VFGFVFLLFILVPILEIALLIKVGGFLGFWMTLFIVILTAVIGTVMLRAQSFATLASVQARMQAGQLPAQELIGGAVLLVGGVLLLTPGFITDGIGFICLVPFTRAWLAKLIMSRVQMKAFHGGATFTNAQNPVNQPPTGHQSPRPPISKDSSNIIEGEFRRED